MAKVVVIGAGVGGLAAAARLGAAGHDVTICEAAGNAGGKLGCHEERTPAGRFRFDVGPTLLTLPHVFTRLFDDTGDPLDSVLSLDRLDPIVRHRFADGAQVDTTSDPARQRACFDDALGAGTGAAWQRLLDRGAAIWRAVEQPVFGAASSGSSAFSLGRRAWRLADVRAVAPGRTLRGLARTLLPDPRQQLMLERYATYVGSDPRRAPAALAVTAYLEHAFGGWYVRGGLHRLAEALVARTQELGVRLRLNTRVAGVEVTGGRVSAAQLDDGARLPADVVVSDADAELLYTALNPRPRVPTADSLSGFVMLLGLRGSTPGLAQHTVLFAPTTYDDEFDAVFGRPARPVADPVVYLHAPRDASCAPAGHEALYVLVNAPRHGAPADGGHVDWTSPGAADRYADHVVQVLARRGTDLRDRIVFRHLRTPADLERDTSAPGGAIYGRAQHGALAPLRRPANRSRTQGLFLVGGSTHPGGGLPLVALSAQGVAAEVGTA
ncbi:phytoene desaturase family protein [uncultured Jatrophihabitans sp.]|uniref:phytoene desaturase family protein n=1 Tax=uncultured Jatrophihabitans sp. TaxID=1610747 RepID=UPI0035C969DE